MPYVHWGIGDSLCLSSYVHVLVNSKFDYHLHVVDIKLSIEAHKFQPNIHNSTINHSIDISIP